MSDILKPMLSGKAPDDLTTLTYPLMASVKLDGIRCLIKGRKAVSRKFKDIPNDYVREQLKDLPDGLDGELLMSDWTRPFKEVSSAIMSKDGEPDFVYAVFDLLPKQGPSVPFKERNQLLEWTVGHHSQEGVPVVRVRQVLIETPEDLQDFMAVALEMGYEGAMVRAIDSPYKFGRSTVKQGYLLKLKNFVDEEATVIDVVEQMHNGNELETDELGHAKRSTHKENKTGKGTLGSLKCRFADGTTFNVGTGFDDALRKKIWDDFQDDLECDVIGATVKIKHQPDPGGRLVHQPPRFPVFLGFRNTEID